jgi:hypothetical protein
VPQHKRHAGWRKKPLSGSGGSSSLQSFERTWRGLTRFRAKVGVARFRDLMIDVPDALEEIRSPDQRGVAEFHSLLGAEDFRRFLDVAPATRTSLRFSRTRANLTPAGN